jgi:hypothetical protein
MINSKERGSSETTKLVKNYLWFTALGGLLLC